MRTVKKKRYLLIFTFLGPFVLGASGMIFTLDKLEKMKMIRGFKPGATVRLEVVRDKWRDRNRDAYWVLTSPDTNALALRRLNLPREVWEAYSSGDEIEIVYLPHHNGPYHRNGIYASDSNFAFDRFLLVVEQVVTVISGIGVLVAWVIIFRQRRRALFGMSQTASREL